MPSFSTSDFKAEKLYDVTGWVAVVTGGGTGLGLMTAAALLANGAKRVYITGRRENVLQNAVKTHGQAPGVIGELIPIVSDVRKKDDISKLVSTICQKDSYVNLVVNNASTGDVKNDFQTKTTVQDMSHALFSCDNEAWDTILHLNATAMYFVAVAFLPLLVAAKGPFPNTGSIINVSSMSGITKRSQGGQFAYNVAKAATISLTHQLAFEFRNPPLGVRVNTIAPGFFPSEMTPESGFPSDPEAARAQRGVPAGRIGSPTDYAQAILSLAVNAYMTGSVLLIDGGWLLEQS
ncbi:hypothetical protein M422DRAFT_252171 [Sphaerobolus stellatus SS14]|uniref:3-oxoacyl-[acyl-carrier-protein] reductase n=1 Tax=Sphaerobolus stellatus (strain SS14) TaxID=990650 RepID=A0A0C9VZM8_SPHS4|nr:hypothetical protein M422DRAFT_252171 [Sphaerobolus stellatus SS14]